MDKKSILVFGLGFLQKSLISRCKAKGLFTVGIDPCPDAVCKDDVDVFEIVGGQDYEKTLEVARRYNVSGVITTATDKPLVMMARVAETLKLPFFSVETALWSTDKYLMKQRFIEGGVPCAKGFIISSPEEFKNMKESQLTFPVIVKPRDNSGSRGVIFCKDENELRKAFAESMEYTMKTSVLVEEFVDGQEYSIESIHYNGRSEVIQFTEKRTTEFPYNVELGHIQPANISEDNKNKIREIVEKIAKALNFNNCGSHTELKIGSRGIVVIETSPRFGGDFITSTLVPLSTGINIDDVLIEISIGNSLNISDLKPKYNRFSEVVFLNLPEGRITKIGNLDDLKDIDGLHFYHFGLKEGDVIPKIKNSLDRYGDAAFVADDRDFLDKSVKLFNQIIDKQIDIEKLV